MEQEVYSRILEQALISPGADVTVALSGGADSVALLLCLRALAPRLDVRLRAAHLHHGIRGAEADRDAAFCAALCRRLEIPLVLGRADAPARAARTGESLELAARTLRYRFLEAVSPGLIATAHNADDNAETLLLHLVRGTGPRGLGGIPPRRGRIVRPLLGTRRQQILDYLARQGQDFCQDSTNREDDALRNRLRHRVLPLLLAENPRLIERLGRTMALQRREDEWLSARAEEALAESRQGAGWSCAALAALDPVLLGRCLLGLLYAQGLESPGAVYVRALEQLVRSGGPSARVDLPGNRQARREYDTLLLGPRPSAQGLTEQPLAVPGRTDLSDGSWILTYVTKNLNFCQKKLSTIALKCDMIGASCWWVRGRLPGDRICLPGGSKTLKRLMIDRRVPRHLRHRLPVLLCDGTVAGVPGLAADLRFRPEGEGPALVVEYHPAEESRPLGGYEGEVL